MNKIFKKKKERTKHEIRGGVLRHKRRNTIRPNQAWGPSPALRLSKSSNNSSPLSHTYYVPAPELGALQTHHLIPHLSPLINSMRQTLSPFTNEENGGSESSELAQVSKWYSLRSELSSDSKSHVATFVSHMTSLNLSLSICS